MEGLASDARQRGIPRKWLAAAQPISLMTIFLLMAACSAASVGQPGASAGDREAAPSRAPGNDTGQPGPGQGDGVPFADLVDRKIVKTGEITLEVPRVSAAAGEVRAMAVSLGGYVSGSQAGGADDAATLTLRVPAESVDEALERLRDLDGEIRVEATSEEDVTASVVDLEARIRNLQVSEEQYRALVEQAGNVDDILAVQRRLDEVRGEIEQLTAQLQQLSGLAALSTLTVTLVPVATPVEDAAEGWDPGATWNQAVAALVSAGQAVADLAIWLLVVVVPLVLIALLMLWLGLRIAPLVRRRFPPAPAADD
jgi:hypothetical protein